MILAAVFNPVQTLSGSFTAPTLQTGSTMIVDNKSYVDILLTFANGDTKLVLANDRRSFTFNNQSAVSNPTVLWQQENIDYPQTVLQLRNIVYVEVYQPGETVVESYPSSMTRQPVPQLIPYNVGHTTWTLSTSPSAAGVVGCIFPSSYPGLSCCPANTGMGIDHYYSYYNPSNGSYLDIAGLYGNRIWGNVELDATPTSFGGTGTQSIIPGPFSYPGLTPQDSANQLNNFGFTVATDLTTNTSWYLDCWTMISNSFGPLSQQTLIADNNTPSTNKGFLLGIDSNGYVNFYVQYTTSGLVHMISANPITLNSWHHIAIENIGNGTANNLNLYVDGQIVSTFTSSGTVTLPTSGSIGIGYYPGATSSYFVGALTNVAICNRSLLANTNWDGAITRYLLGQQTRTIDTQNAFITSIHWYAAATGGATSQATNLLVSPTYNPGGLLFTPTLAAQTSLHRFGGGVIGGGGQINLRVPALASQASYETLYNPAQPVSHWYDTFITMTMQSGGTTFPHNYILVSGYNILGIY